MCLRVNNICMECKIFAVVHYIFGALRIHPYCHTDSIYHLAMVILAMSHCIFSISSCDGQYLQQFLASLVYLLTMLRWATRVLFQGLVHVWYMDIWHRHSEESVEMSLLTASYLIYSLYLVPRSGSCLVYGYMGSTFGSISRNVFFADFLRAM